MFDKKKKVDGKLLLDKKAQNLSITTIILIILGIIVLVVLIVGFTQGWDSVKGWFISSSGDSQKAVSECAVACSTGNKIDWCANNKYTIENIKYSCDNLLKTKWIKECTPKIECPKNCKEIDLRYNLADVASGTTDCPDGKVRVDSKDTDATHLCCKP